MEFLVHVEIVSLGTGQDARQLLEQEAARARELAALGVMRRLWRIPGRRANWGIWETATIDELHAALASLPLYPYMSVTVHPLATHPNDPRLPLNIVTE